MKVAVISPEAIARKAKLTVIDPVKTYIEVEVGT